MPAFEESTFSEANFCGVVRLFPLPNLVFFPHVLQPLHVFEPRYRELVREALASDGLIAMGTLLPGWEKDYEGRPPVYPLACLGQIVSHHQIENGSYNILLMGVKRVRLLRELAPAKNFREVQAELCHDLNLPADSQRAADLQDELRRALRQLCPRLPEVQEQVDQILSSDVALGTLADIVAYMLDIGLAEKQSLLAELNVLPRVERLLAHLNALARSDSPMHPFPPVFSSN